jgi:serine/threonine protein kinase
VPTIKKSGFQFVQENHEFIPTKNSLYLIYPFANEGNLKEKTANRSLTFSDLDLVPYLMQVLLGVWELQKSGLLHRKIKPSNFFLENPDSKKFYRLKIGDPCWFPMKQSEYRDAESCDLHLAPEVLLSERKTNFFEPSVYVWTVGFMAYFLLVGEEPRLPDYYEFASNSKISDFKNKINQTTGDRIDLSRRKLAPASQDDIGNFIKKTLVGDASRRLSFAQVFEHPLFLNYLQRNPKGFSQSSQAVIESFLQARQSIRNQSLGQLEDFVVFPPSEELNPYNYFNDAPPIANRGNSAPSRGNDRAGSTG